MKILNIIQARINSKRLPGKVFKELYNGLNILEIILKKLFFNNIVVVVPYGDVDKFKEKLPDDVWIHGGSKDDVLSRFVDVIKIKKPDYVVRICADNPFISPIDIENACEEMYKNNYDYFNNWVEPEGCRFEVIRAKLLVDIYGNKKLTNKDREHVTSFIWNNPRKYKIHEMLRIYKFPDRLNIALDTPTDLAVIRNIFNECKFSDVRDYHLNCLFKKNPGIFKLAYKKQLAGYNA